MAADQGNHLLTSTTKTTSFQPSIFLAWSNLFLGQSHIYSPSWHRVGKPSTALNLEGCIELEFPKESESIPSITRDKPQEGLEKEGGQREESEGKDRKRKNNPVWAIGWFGGGWQRWTVQDSNELGIGQWMDAPVLSPQPKGWAELSSLMLLWGSLAACKGN